MTNHPPSGETGQAERCFHPTPAIRYYSEIADDGSLYEEYICLACNFWMPPSFTSEYHSRADWDEDISYDEFEKRLPASPEKGSELK